MTNVIGKTACGSCRDAEETLAKGPGDKSKSDVVGFEQHMKEEDEVRLNWQSG